jgi:hypothetical protein
MVNRRQRVTSVLVGSLATISVVSIVFIGGQYAQFGSTAPLQVELELVRGANQQMLSIESQKVTAEDFRELFQSNAFE